MKFLASKERKDLLPCIAICLVVAAAFFPSLANGFTNFDDNAYVTENPLVRSLAPGNIKRIFTTTRPHTVFAPLVTLSFALEYRLWELDPRGYHAVNLLLHHVQRPAGVFFDPRHFPLADDGFFRQPALCRPPAARGERCLDHGAQGPAVHFFLPAGAALLYPLPEKGLGPGLPGNAAPFRLRHPLQDERAGVAADPAAHGLEIRKEDRREALAREAPLCRHPAYIRGQQLEQPAGLLRGRSPAGPRRPACGHGAKLPSGHPFLSAKNRLPDPSLRSLPDRHALFHAAAVAIHPAFAGPDRRVVPAAEKNLARVAVGLGLLSPRPAAGVRGRLAFFPGGQSLLLPAGRRPVLRPGHGRLPVPAKCWRAGRSST